MGRLLWEIHGTRALVGDLVEKASFWRQALCRAQTGFTSSEWVSLGPRLATYSIGTGPMCSVSKPQDVFGALESLMWPVCGGAS